ncbi:MAG: hypothetical protein WAW39_10495 [Prosthecobacter sp.]
MIGLGLALPLFQPPRDITPGGATDVWEWEAGLGMQWETNMNTPVE